MKTTGNWWQHNETPNFFIHNRSIYVLHLLHLLFHFEISQTDKVTIESDWILVRCKSQWLSLCWTMRVCFIFHLLYSRSCTESQMKGYHHSALWEKQESSILETDPYQWLSKPNRTARQKQKHIKFFRNVMDFVEWRCFQNSVFLQYLWKTTTSSELVLILWTEGLYLIAHALILKVTKRHYTFLIPFSLFNPAVGRMHGDEVCLLVTVQDCKKNCHMMVKPTNSSLFRCRTSGLQGGFFSQFILSNLP